MDDNTDRLIKECTFKAVTSGGKGGQHVNKVATRIELYFNIIESNFLSEEQKQKLKLKLKNKLNREGELRIIASSERSQYQNKKLAITKFINLISSALVDPKKRKRSTLPQSAIQLRLEKKRIRSVLKRSRKKLDDN
jgi:ribosome-associated protein